MSTLAKWILGIGAVLVAALIYFNWDKLKVWWVNLNSKDSSENTENHSSNNPPVTVQTVEVSNPSGAFMYYQQALSSGGILYAKSNVLIPFGTKFVLLNTVQNTSMVGKYFYETDFKHYGANSGFFNADDLTKISGSRQKICWEHTGQGSHQVPCKENERYASDLYIITR